MSPSSPRQLPHSSASSGGPPAGTRARGLPPLHFRSPARSGNALPTEHVPSPSSASVAADDIPQLLWCQLDEQRSKERHLRTKLTRRRADLGEARRRADAADNDFMGFLRLRVLAGHGSQPSAAVVSRLFDQMRLVRTAYDFVENDVEQLEAQLDDGESAREVLETQFFNYFYSFISDTGSPGSSPEPSDAGGDVPPSSNPVFEIPLDPPAHFPGLIYSLSKRLLDAAGGASSEFELAKERCAGLVIKRDHILYELDLSMRRSLLRSAGGAAILTMMSGDNHTESLQTLVAESATSEELRACLGLAMDEDDYDFLKSFSKDHAAAQEDLTRAREKAQRLKYMCVKSGAMRDNSPHDEEYDASNDSKEPPCPDTERLDGEPDSRPSDRLARTRFRVLLSNPQHLFGPEPSTPLASLRNAIQLDRNDPSRDRRIAKALREHSISSLLADAPGDDKSNFVNRWLLHRLRNSPAEAELLRSIFSARQKIHNLRRWQEDVQYYWSLDGANQARGEPEGPATSGSSLAPNAVSLGRAGSSSKYLSRPLGRPGDVSWLHRLRRSVATLVA